MQADEHHDIKILNAIAVHNSSGCILFCAPSGGGGGAADGQLNSYSYDRTSRKRRPKRTNYDYDYDYDYDTPSGRRLRVEIKEQPARERIFSLLLQLTSEGGAEGARGVRRRGGAGKYRSRWSRWSLRDELEWAGEQASTGAEASDLPLRRVISRSLFSPLAFAEIYCPYSERPESQRTERAKEQRRGRQEQRRLLLLLALFRSPCKASSLALLHTQASAYSFSMARALLLTLTRGMSWSSVLLAPGWLSGGPLS